MITSIIQSYLRPGSGAMLRRVKGLRLFASSAATTPVSAPTSSKNAAFAQKPLGLLDYLQRSVTLALFAVTCAGAYTLGEGAYHIVGRKYGFLPSRPAVKEGEQVDRK